MDKKIQRLIDSAFIAAASFIIGSTLGGALLAQGGFNTSVANVLSSNIFSSWSKHASSTIMASSTRRDDEATSSKKENKDNKDNRNKVSAVSLVSAVATAGMINQQGSTTIPSSMFVFTVKPNGVGIKPISSSSFSVKFGTSFASSSAKGVSTAIINTPNDSILADGGVYTVNVSAIVPVMTNPSVPAGSSIDYFFLSDLKLVDTNNNPVKIGTSTIKWITNPVTIVK